jgi:hypothetical protein
MTLAYAIKKSKILILASSCALGGKQTHYKYEELHFVLLVASAVKTLFSISQRRTNQSTLNKQLGYHLNKKIMNASTSFLSFHGCFHQLNLN